MGVGQSHIWGSIISEVAHMLMLSYVREMISSAIIVVALQNYPQFFQLLGKNCTLSFPLSVPIVPL
jgi:hypothetical protein